VKLSIAGGYGEYGRSCFFIESTRTAFLVDCGIMPGVSDPYPRLSDEQILSAKWLFITHSHVDHSGAYDWLCRRGFSGCTVMTGETADQLEISAERLCLINNLSPAMAVLQLDKELSVVWGKSGQCVGSVWYYICVDNKRALFSGDYVEDNLVYRCDQIRDFNADLAVLDSAYGSAEHTPADYRTALIEKVKGFIEQNKPILFPVPKYGRGFELLLLLYRCFPRVPFMSDAHFRGELSRINDYEDWLKPETLAQMQNIDHVMDITFSDSNAFIFISDPQLKSPESDQLAKKISDMGGIIVITGHTDTGSLSENLLMTKRAVFLRYAVHMNDNERTELEKLNFFTEVIPYHTDFI
jgi:Cft2 family RNA processing exonuclease